jgi:LacI family transcriptional regulator
MASTLPLPNYRTIAKESGVGKTTVGRVLQNSGYVSEAVRSRVLETARRLGYRPDPALGALARRRWPDGARPTTATIAYIHHGILTDPIKAPPQLRGVRQRAEELGYAVDAFSLKEYPTFSALNRVLHARGIHGVLVQAFRNNIHLDLEWPQFFTVFIGPENDLARVHNVQADFRSALHQAVQACRSRGYRKIGMALMNHAASGTNIPLHAQALYERLGLEQECGRQPEILTYEPTNEFAPQFFRWFREARPDAVLATNIQPYDWLTSATHYDRRQKNRKIPGDVAFVCTRHSAHAAEVAHVDLRENEQGRQAVDLMHQQLQHGAIGKPEIPLRLLIPPAFVEGQSLPQIGAPNSLPRED